MLESNILSPRPTTTTAAAAAPAAAAAAATAAAATVDSTDLVDSCPRGTFFATIDGSRGRFCEG